MKLMFGLGRAVPDEVKTAWGARLIAPNDLLYDRQDLSTDSKEDKAELVAWLNGGAIREALDWLRDNRYTFPDGEQFTVFEDSDGIIVANTNRSGGYVYVAGWLKPDRHEAAALREIRRSTAREPEFGSREEWEAALDSAELRRVRRQTELGRAHDALTVDHYEIARKPITVERWTSHYGWSKAEAEKMGEIPTATEVRVFAVYGDGARRELEGPAGSFEFGYGGSGPHETARAIVADRDSGDRSPADLQRLVPEVFSPAGRESMTLTVSAADVDARRMGVTA
jgi:hypothetical protein